MDFKSKVEKIRELDKESRKLQREIVAEIESQLPDLFLNNGFELDPRKVKEGMIGYDRSFYDPYNRMSIIYGPIDKNGINFSVLKREEDGIGWAEPTYSGGKARWNYKDESFEDFLKGAYSNRVKNINNYIKRYEKNKEKV